MFLNGEFDDKNSILTQQTHQHHHAYLCVNVVGKSHEFEQQKRSEYSGGEGEHHYQRENEAFVLRGEHQVHKGEHDEKDVDRFISALYFVLRKSGPVNAITSRQRLQRNFLNGTYRLSATVSIRGRSVDGGRRVHVVSCNLV